MPRKDEFIEKAFKVFEQDGIPTEQQKDMMLSRILTECKAEDTSGIGKIKKMIVTYPWRFGFYSFSRSSCCFYYDFWNTVHKFVSEFLWRINL